MTFSDHELVLAIDWEAEGFAPGARAERALVDLYTSWGMTVGQVVLRLSQLRRAVTEPATRATIQDVGQPVGSQSSLDDRERRAGFFVDFDSAGPFQPST